MKKIRSRIHEFIDNDLMLELDKICRNVVVTDNNIKAATIKQTLDNHGMYYNELGPGTNRIAVLIDGYVFKIAMDKWGKQDNANEFTMSKELQPFVIKVYENNDLISVSEYVTLISREEFTAKKNEILKILSILSESYLLGDVGYVTKNFTNWGYRDDGSLVILDFAYIHNIQGEEMFCPNDSSMLEYDMYFHKLRCPKCSKQFSFSDIRRRIPIDDEWAYINDVKNHSYQLTSSSIIIKEDGEQSNKINKKEEVQMPDKEFTEEVIEDGYRSALDKLRQGLLTEEVKPVVIEETDDIGVSNIIDDEDDNGFGSAVELMRRVSNVVVSEEEPDEEQCSEEEEYNDNDENFEEEEEEISLNVQRAIEVSNNESTGEDVEEYEVITKEDTANEVEQQEEQQEDFEVIKHGDTDGDLEITVDGEPELDFHAIIGSITEEDEASAQAITRSTPVTGVSILTGNSEVDVVVSETNGNEATIIIATNSEPEKSEEEKEDDAKSVEIKIKLNEVSEPETVEVEVVETTVVKEPTETKPDLLAEAYNQRMNNFRSTIRLTRPDDNNVDGEEKRDETEQEKYERLARESGYYEE